MWLCRQIPKHKLTDMSKQRNQANKQTQKEKKHLTQKKPSSLSGGLYPFGDIININGILHKINFTTPHRVKSRVSRQIPFTVALSIYRLLFHGLLKYYIQSWIKILVFSTRISAFWIFFTYSTFPLLFFLFVWTLGGKEKINFIRLLSLL
jgi:hypothetical protein